MKRVQADLRSVGARASDGDRERVGSLLAVACQHGYLSLETFSYRVERALESKTNGELDQLISDLPSFPRWNCPNTVQRLRRRVTGLLRAMLQPGPTEPALLAPKWSPTHTVVTIGRSPESDVEIRDDDSVSRHHAQLVRIGRAWVLSDLGSLNGTYVNGRRVSSPTLLTSNDRVMLGETATIFQRPTPPPS